MGEKQRETMPRSHIKHMGRRANVPDGKGGEFRGGSLRGEALVYRLFATLEGGVRSIQPFSLLLDDGKELVSAHRADAIPASFPAFELPGGAVPHALSNLLLCEVNGFA